MCKRGPMIFLIKISAQLHFDLNHVVDLSLAMAGSSHSTAARTYILMRPGWIRKVINFSISVGM